MSQAIIIIKPDAIERNLTEILITRILKEFKLVSIKDVVFTEELCDAHYAEHINKPFYPGLKQAMVGKRVFVLAVSANRNDGLPETPIRPFCDQIRREYVDSQYIGPRNIIHCSDSEVAALREWNIWFSEPQPQVEWEEKQKKSNKRKASKIVDKDAFLTLVNEQIYERDGKLGEDLSKVNFDFENCSCTTGEYPMYGDLLGYNKIGNFEFCGCAAGGDWEYPVFFLVYLDKDGKTLRGFVPKEGNAWNYDTKEALGNDEEVDAEFLIKALKIEVDEDQDASEYGDELINVDLLKETIASRFEVV